MAKSKHKPYQWIDGETADRITSLNLKDYRAYLKKEVEEESQDRRQPRWCMATPRGCDG